MKTFCLNSNYSASGDVKFTKIVYNKRNTLCQLVQYEKFIALTRDRTQPGSSLECNNFLVLHSLALGIPIELHHRDQRNHTMRNLAAHRL